MTLTFRSCSRAVAWLEILCMGVATDPMLTRESSPPVPAGGRFVSSSPVRFLVELAAKWHPPTT